MEIENKQQSKEHFKSSFDNKKEDKSDFDKKIIVHTMPKRFISAHSSSRKNKSMGFIILIGGAIVLVAALAFLYYYITELNQDLSVELNDDKDLVINEVKQDQETKKISEDIEKKQSDQKQSLANQDKDTKNNINIPKPNISTTSGETREVVTTPIIDSKPTTTKIIINTISTSTKPIIKEAIDSDKDGLADMEEVLFNSSINSLDSDEDGYSDLSEVLNLYNPAGSGKIMVNPNIEKYINGKYNYSLYYFDVWPIDTIGGEDSIIFKISNNQFIQIIIQPNTKKLPIKEWYKEQVGVNVIKGNQIVNKKGWEGVRSVDELVVYLTKPDDENIYILSYNLGVSNMLDYKNIFQMIINSFEIE